MLAINIIIYYSFYILLFIIRFHFCILSPPCAAVSRQSIGVWLFLETEKSTGWLWGALPSKDSRTLHPPPHPPSSLAVCIVCLSEVSFHPCTPGALAPCLWSPLVGCCCYGNSIFRALGPPLRRQAWMEVGLSTTSCILRPVWTEGRRVEHKNEGWPGLGGQLRPQPQVLPPHCVTRSTQRQIPARPWLPGPDFNYLGGTPWEAAFDQLCLWF